jgi:acyl-CoA dehydrogenase
VYDLAMRELVHALVASPVDDRPIPSLDAWWERHVATGARFDRTIERAAACGFQADTLGYAFASGYHAALGALCPELPRDQLAALCATERGGAHPRAIETKLEPRGAGFVLSGHKRWATLSTRANEFLVVASTGVDERGKNRLAVVRVPSGAPGVVVRPMPETPFAPEIPHAEIDLVDVAVEAAAVLPGDGYDRYLKPFRTVEDEHVTAAALGHAVRLARTEGLSRARIEEAVALLASVAAISAEPPSAPETHLALAGFFQLFGGFVERLGRELADKGGAAHARFARDTALFGVAQGARTKRSEAAWGSFDRR